MIVVIEVTGRESDIVIPARLTHRRLFFLHLHLLRVHSQIGNCKISSELIDFSRHVHWSHRRGNYILSSALMQPSKILGSLAWINSSVTVDKLHVRNRKYDCTFQYTRTTRFFLPIPLPFPVTQILMSKVIFPRDTEVLGLSSKKVREKISLFPVVIFRDISLT